MTVVSNSTPLIYLAALSDFDLLRELFGDITIPPAVYQEVLIDGAGYPAGEAASAAMGDWLHVTKPRSSTPVLRDVHPGEAEVIALARETSAEAVLVDDRVAVRQIRSLGFLVIPTPSIYIRAKRLGLVGSVREKLDQLRLAGFWLKDADYDLVLREAGEL